MSSIGPMKPYPTPEPCRRCGVVRTHHVTYPAIKRWFRLVRAEYYEYIYTCDCGGRVACTDRGGALVGWHRWASNDRPDAPAPVTATHDVPHIWVRQPFVNSAPGTVKCSNCGEVRKMRCVEWLHDSEWPTSIPVPEST